MRPNIYLFGDGNRFVENNRYSSPLLISQHKVNAVNTNAIRLRQIQVWKIVGVFFPHKVELFTNWFSVTRRLEYKDWVSSVVSVLKKDPSKKLVILEIGCGLRVPSIRKKCEEIYVECPKEQVTRTLPTPYWQNSSVNSFELILTIPTTRLFTRLRFLLRILASMLSSKLTAFWSLSVLFHFRIRSRFPFPKYQFTLK